MPARVVLSPTDVLTLLLLAVGLCLLPRRDRPPVEAALHRAVRALVHVMYRFDKQGLQHLPRVGPALLVCNHVSFIDAFVIAAASPRPIRFVMHHRIYGMPVINAFSRAGGVIPIASRHEDPQLLEEAFARIDDRLAAGELVCIFPEGKITWDGAMNPFRPGVERILSRRAVPVVPIGLQGLWGSFFSRRYGDAMRSRPRRFWSRITLRCGAPIRAHRASLEVLHDRVAELAGLTPPATQSP